MQKKTTATLNFIAKRALHLKLTIKTNSIFAVAKFYTTYLIRF